jgi:hypothetical protein
VRLRNGVARGLAILALPLVAALWNVPIQLPEPIRFPNFVDSAAVSGAIITAMSKRRWIVEGDTGESIRAHFDVREHRLRLRVDYSPRGISFHYVDSTNLDEERPEGSTDPDAVLIHRRANKWIRVLGQEVQVQVQPWVFARDPTAVVPVDPALPVTAPEPPDPAPAPPR